MIRRPPRSTLSSSSAASDVYKRQISSGVVGATNIRLENVQQENSLIDYTDNHFMSLTQRDLDKVRTSIHQESPHIGYDISVSYTHLRAHETKANLVCRLLLEKKKKKKRKKKKKNKKKKKKKNTKHNKQIQQTTTRHKPSRV